MFLTANFNIFLEWLFPQHSFLKLKTSQARRWSQSLLILLYGFYCLIEFFQHRFPIFLSEEICKVFVILPSSCRLCWILNIPKVRGTLIKKFMHLLLFFISVLINRRQLNTCVCIQILSTLHQLTTRLNNFIFLLKLKITCKSHLLICQRCNSLLKCRWRSKLNWHVVQWNFFRLTTHKWRLLIHNLSNRRYFTFPFWWSFMTGKQRLRNWRNKLILYCLLMN